MGPGTRLPQFESLLCCFLAVDSWLIAHSSRDLRGLLRGFNEIWDNEAPTTESTLLHFSFLKLVTLSYSCCILRKAESMALIRNSGNPTERSYFNTNMAILSYSHSSSLQKLGRGDWEKKKTNAYWTTATGICQVSGWVFYTSYLMLCSMRCHFIDKIIETQRD